MCVYVRFVCVCVCAHAGVFVWTAALIYKLKEENVQLASKRLRATSTIVKYIAFQGMHFQYPLTHSTHITSIASAGHVFSVPTYIREFLVPPHT